MGKAKAKIVEAPPEPDALTLLSSRLLLEVNHALVSLRDLQGLTARRSGRAQVLEQILVNIRGCLMEM